MSETENAIWCEECEELECVHCHDVNGTAAEIEAHARTCPERPTG